MMLNHVIKLFFILLILCHSAFAGDVLTSFDEDSLPKLNEELRKLDIEQQIKQKSSLSMNSKKITDLATATASTDATNKAYVDAQSKFKVGTFTRDVSDASGTQEITGVGFEPKAFTFFACVDSTNNVSWGLDDTSSKFVVLDFNDSAPGIYNTNSVSSIYMYFGVGIAYEGYVSATSSDGFTITWTKTGLPTGTLLIRYKADR